MSHERLVHILSPALKSIRPESEMAQARSMAHLFNPDGTLNLDALVSILPWQPRDWYIAGTASVAENVGARHRVRQASRLVYLDANAKTGPSGGPWIGQIVIAGVSNIGSVSIASGNTTGTTTASAPIPAGALLELNCTAANSAANVSVTAWLVPDI